MMVNDGYKGYYHGFGGKFSMVDQPLVNDGYPGLCVIDHHGSASLLIVLVMAANGGHHF